MVTLTPVLMDEPGRGGKSTSILRPITVTLIGIEIPEDTYRVGHVVDVLRQKVIRNTLKMEFMLLNSHHRS